MPSIICPSCLAALRTPQGLPAGKVVKCPKCAHQFVVGAAKPANPGLSKKLERMQVDDLLVAAAAAKPPARANGLPKPARPEPELQLPPPPPTRRGWLVGVAFTSVGLSAGLLVALVVALSSRDGPGPEADGGALAGNAELKPVNPNPKGKDDGPPKDGTGASKPDQDSAAAKTQQPPEASPAKDGQPPLVKPRPKKAPTPPAALEHWLQDFDQAKQQAREQGKDVLLLFDASDWSANSKALAQEVLARPVLWRRLTELFIPVHIDFPKYPTALRRVQDPLRNEKLRARFFRYPAYPRTILTDIEGRPYDIEIGYEPGQAELHVTKLEGYRKKREDRDELLAAVGKADGPDKLRAAKAALEFLEEEVERPTPRPDGTYILCLVEFYGPLLKEWRGLADTLDRDNAAGYREHFFRADWGRRYVRAMAARNPDTAGLRVLVAEFDGWRAQCRFKDPDLGAKLLGCQALLYLELGNAKAAEREVQAALALNPSTALQKALARMLRPEARARVGTGFAVAPGYVVTNHHIVSGQDLIKVRLPRGQQPLPCKVVAQDESTDLALLKVELPPKVTLPWLRIASQVQADRGTQVMTLGFGLGGSTPKLTVGAVSARQDDLSDGSPLLLLDLRVNPGNSGGPLCDTFGNVVGVVSAKTTASAEVDSYGFAVPAGVLDQFLRKNLKDKDYRTLAPLRKKLEWAEVDKLVSLSVVQVLTELR